jgi:hypothetical protein
MTEVPWAALSDRSSANTAQALTESRLPVGSQLGRFELDQQHRGATPPEGPVRPHHGRRGQTLDHSGHVSGNQTSLRRRKGST